MIIYKQGDATIGPERYLAHGCNTKGVMGAGIAKVIKEKFPYAFADYRKTYEDYGLELGQVILSARKDKVIFNCITQEAFGRDGKQYASYTAVAKCFERIGQLVPYGSEVAMPMIGCGLGGLEWGTVKQLLEVTATNYVAVVYQL